MSDGDFEEDFGDEEYESDGIKNLRKQAKTLAKQNTELQEQLSKALAASRRATVNDTLRTLGANPKIAKYIPNDLDPTEDAVKAWLNEDGELFGYKPADNQSEDKDQGQAAQWAGQQLPPELVAAFTRVQNPESFGGVQTQGADAQALAQMKSMAEQAKGSFYAFEEAHRKLAQ